MSKCVLMGGKVASADIWILYFCIVSSLIALAFHLDLVAALSLEHVNKDQRILNGQILHK